MTKEKKVNSNISVEITPEILAKVREISKESKISSKITFKSDEKPSFPGYKPNYMI